MFFPYCLCMAIGRGLIKNTALKIHLRVYIGNIAKCVKSRHRFLKRRFFLQNVA